MSINIDGITRWQEQAGDQHWHGLAVPIRYAAQDMVPISAIYGGGSNVDLRLKILQLIVQRIFFSGHRGVGVTEQREAKKSNREEKEKFEKIFSNFEKRKRKGFHFSRFERRKRNFLNDSPLSRRERERDFISQGSRGEREIF